MKNKFFIVSRNIFIFSVMFLTCARFVVAATGVPSVISYQGRLADANGLLLGGTGTNYFFKFSIWDNSTVGSGTKLWPSSSPGTVTLSVAEGVFNVNIGDTSNGYPDALTYNFQDNDNVYLQVEVSTNGSTFETLGPRQRITASGMAINARTLGGLLPSYFLDANNLTNFSTPFDNAFSAKTTDTLSEGVTNKYFTTSLFNSNFASKSTSNLAEGTNLYYTDARARSALSAVGPLSYVPSTGVFSIAQSSGSASGYLSSVDWNTFNNKQNAITTGTSAQYLKGDLTLGTFPTALSSFTNDQGFITGITSGNVTTALGYTPYNATNPAGYISSYTETDPIFSTWLTSTPPLYSYTETDPVFAASQAYNITSTDILNLSNLSGTNTGDETTSSIQAKLGTASTSTSGYLTSTDWNTFNSKQNAITTGTSGQYIKGDLTLGTFPTTVSVFTNDAGYLTSISSGDVTSALGYTPYDSSNPASYISGITGSDVTTALGYTPYDDTNPSGYITASSADNLTNKTGDISQWTNDVGYITSGSLSGYVLTTRTLTINGASYDLSADQSWTVGDVSTSGSYSNPTWITSLDWSKIASLPSTLSGYGITDAVPNTRTVNGHALSANVTITASDLGLGSVENTALSTWAGSTNITTLGTIATGVWQGTAIDDSYIASASIWNAKESALTFSTGLTRTNNTITNNLSTGVSGGQSVIGGTGSGDNLTLSSTSNSTKGKVLFGTSAYDEVNNRLGVGTTSPGARLDIRALSSDTSAFDITVADANPYVARFTNTATSSSVQEFFDASGNFQIRNTHAGGGLWFNTANGTASAPKMVLDSSGQLGIGMGTSGNTVSSKLEVRTNSLGVTQTTSSGLALTNTTAAALGAQQISPAIRFSGKGWGTTASTSQAVDFRQYVVPVQSTVPTGYLSWGSSINGAAYTDNQMVLTSGGFVGIGTTNPQVALEVTTSNTSGMYATATNYPLSSFPITSGHIVYNRVSNNFETMYMGVDNASGAGFATGGLTYAGQIIVGGAHPLQFATNSVVNMTILSSGNVGIGTNAPNEQLEIANSAGARSVLTDAGGASRRALLMQAPTSTNAYARVLAYNYGGSTGLPLVLQDTGGGNVGINTTTPNAKLDINGLFTVKNAGLDFVTTYITDNNSGEGGVQMGNTNSGSGAGFRFIVADNSNDAYLAFFMPSTGNTGTIFGQTRSTVTGIFTNATTTQRNLVFGTVGAKDVIFGTSNTERMRILSGGNVGIGTSAPTFNMDISTGSGGTTSGIRINQSTNNASAVANFSRLEFDNNNGYLGGLVATGGNYANAGAPYLPNNSILLLNEVNGSVVVGATGASGDIRFGTGGYAAANERMRILSGGNVGIGTTAPASKLEVQTNALGTTQTTSSGLALTNTTAAAAGSQQISPAIRFSSNGWGTTASTSQDVSFRNYSFPIQSTTPVGVLSWEKSTSGGAYSNLMSLSTSGLLGIGIASGTVPSAKLHIWGDATNEALLRFTPNSNASFQGIEFTNTANGSPFGQFKGNAQTGEIRMGSATNGGFATIYDNLGENTRFTGSSVGIGATVPSSKLEVRTNSLGTTQTTTSGIALANTTAATVGAQQISPALRFSGFGWKTNATAASQSVDLRNYLLPVQGAAAPTGNLIWEGSIAGGAYSTLASLTTAGQFWLGTTSSGIGIGAASLTTGAADVTGGAVRYFGLAGATGGSYVHYFSNTSTRVAVAGTNGLIKASENFAPTSGTAVYSLLELNPTINQTGGANGITRGVYVNPTLTATADFRAIETSNTTGYSIYTASANSYFGGDVAIGSTTTPLNALQVTDSNTAGSVVYMVNTGTGASDSVLDLGVGAATAGTSNLFTSFYQGSTGAAKGTLIGYIQGNSGAVNYSTTSDRRLKENIVDTSKGLADLLKIEVKDYNFISNPGVTTQGFIAQQLNTIYPYAVANNGDDGVSPLEPGKVPWGVDYGRITPLIVKSIQDMNLKVTNIEDISDSSTFKAHIIAWLGDVTNGIGKIFAGDIEGNKLNAKDELCVGQTCVTEDQLKALLQQAGQSPVPQTQTPPITDVTPSVTPSSDPVITPSDPLVPPSDQAPAPSDTPVIAP